MSAYRWTLEWARKNRVRTLGQLETQSTNAEAKEQVEMLGSGSLVIADHQTAGRGRGDHTWTETAGQALLSSWIFQVPRAPQPVMSALIGLALYEAAQKTWPKVPWALKAPNDLHVLNAKTPDQPKKIAGLLIELVSSAQSTTVIVGLGMNVTGAPQGTAPYPATSLVVELAEQGLTLSEGEWGRFLSAWHLACENRLQEGLVPELKQSSGQLMASALAKHPESRDIQEIRADGSLVFKDGRIIPWTSL